jgi:CarD family transcriptional regulator
MEARAIPLSSEGRGLLFDVGDLVVHPHHGVGRVISNQPRRLDGRERSYLKIDLVDRALTIMVPCESATTVGLRAVVGPPEVRQIMAVLEAESAPAPGNCSARERRYREKLKRPDVLELAAVVRDLGMRAHPDRLALREQELYEQTRRQLACELGHALGITAEQATARIDQHIAHTADRTAHATCGH